MTNSVGSKRAGWRDCLDEHEPVGTVGFPSLDDVGQPPFHNVRRAWLPTCGDDVCLRSANRLIKQVTGFDAYFRPFRVEDTP